MIGHLDADCFYVSCERVRAPALRGQPVGVLGNQGACVIAKSYEMKAHGVKTGVPIWDAVKLCPERLCPKKVSGTLRTLDNRLEIERSKVPDTFFGQSCPEGIYIKRDFRWYEVISQLLLNSLRAVSPTVEYYSIDEMFFDADRIEPRKLQDRILNDVGIPVSMGISKTKTLAKLISDTAKPFGCRIEPSPDLRSFSVEEITGIGERSRVKLAAHGIKTCLDFAQADRHLIRRLLTIKGEAIWWELHGEPVQPIVTQRPAHKCISRGGSIGAATDDREVIIGWIARNVERLVEELRHYRVVAGRLVLIVECKTDVFSAATSLTPTSSFKALVSAARRLFDKMPTAVVAAMHLLGSAKCFPRSGRRTPYDLPHASTQTQRGWRVWVACAPSGDWAGVVRLGVMDARNERDFQARSGGVIGTFHQAFGLRWWKEPYRLKDEPALPDRMRTGVTREDDSCRRHRIQMSAGIRSPPS